MTASICVLVHPWWPMTASDSELSTKISNTYVNFCSDQQQTLSYNLPISSPIHLLSTLKLEKEVSGDCDYKGIRGRQSALGKVGGKNLTCTVSSRHRGSYKRISTWFITSPWLNVMPLMTIV